MFSVANVAKEVRVSQTGKYGFNGMIAQLGTGEAELFRYLIEMKNRPTIHGAGQVVMLACGSRVGRELSQRKRICLL